MDLCRGFGFGRFQASIYASFSRLLLLAGLPSFFGPCPSGLNPGCLWGCPSCFHPRPSGLNLVVFCPFFLSSCPGVSLVPFRWMLRSLPIWAKPTRRLFQKLLIRFIQLSPLLRSSFWVMRRRLLSRMRPISVKLWLMNMSLLRGLSVRFGGGWP